MRLHSTWRCGKEAERLGREGREEEARHPPRARCRTGSLGARTYQPAWLVELYLSCGQRGRVGAAGRGPVRRVGELLMLFFS
ncbi:hypothetical protein MRX96_043043 [Rhipicephalus microplus]